MSVLKHVRRPSAKLSKGRWSIACDCGWHTDVDSMEGASVKPGAQVEKELEQAFRDHLPEKDKVAYILVDTRMVEVPESDAEDAQLVMVPRGNFLMPIGIAVDLLNHYTADGVRWGRYMVRDTGEVGNLVIGEIRTADNRVFKLDSDG